VSCSASKSNDGQWSAVIADTERTAGCRTFPSGYIPPELFQLQPVVLWWSVDVDDQSKSWRKFDFSQTYQCSMIFLVSANFDYCPDVRYKTPSPFDLGVWGSPGRKRVLEYLELEKSSKNTPGSHKSVIFDISAAYI